MLCESCGSINIARSKSSRVDKVVRFFSGKKRFKCNRCGWSALREWDTAVRQKPAKLRLVETENDRPEIDLDQFD